MRATEVRNTMMEDLTLRKSLELAVTTEQLGAEFYGKMAGKFASRKDIADVFKQLSEDEKGHEAAFRTLLGQVPPEKGTGTDKERYAYLRATATSEFFKKDWFERTDDLETLTDALIKAFYFEKATLLYYQAIRDIIGGSLQLDSVIQAEKGHVISLMRVIPTNAEFHGLADTW
jgi:rubrerythrin